MSKRYIEIVEPQLSQNKEKNADEIINGILARSGINMVE